MIYRDDVKRIRGPSFRLIVELVRRFRRIAK
jgi:hypothetical protein